MLALVPTGVAGIGACALIRATVAVFGTCERLGGSPSFTCLDLSHIAREIRSQLSKRATPSIRVAKKGTYVRVMSPARRRHPPRARGPRPRNRAPIARPRPLPSARSAPPAAPVHSPILVASHATKGPTA